MLRGRLADAFSAWRFPLPEPRASVDRLAQRNPFQFLNAPVAQLVRNIQESALDQRNFRCRLEIKLNAESSLLPRFVNEVLVLPVLLPCASTAIF